MEALAESAFPPPRKPLEGGLVVACPMLAGLSDLDDLAADQPIGLGHRDVVAAGELLPPWPEDVRNSFMEPATGHALGSSHIDLLIIALRVREVERGRAPSSASAVLPGPGPCAEPAPRDKWPSAQSSCGRAAAGGSPMGAAGPVPTLSAAVISDIVDAVAVQTYR